MKTKKKKKKKRKIIFTGDKNSFFIDDVLNAVYEHYEKHKNQED